MLDTRTVHDTGFVRITVIWHGPSAVRCVHSDASDVGNGGYIVEHGMHVHREFGLQRKQSRALPGES